MPQSKSKDQVIKELLDRSAKIDGPKLLDNALRHFGLHRPKFEMRVTGEQGLMAPVPFSQRS